MCRAPTGCEPVAAAKSRKRGRSAVTCAAGFSLGGRDSPAPRSPRGSRASPWPAWRRRDRNPRRVARPVDAGWRVEARVTAPIACALEPQQRRQDDDTDADRRRRMADRRREARLMGHDGRVIYSKGRQRPRVARVRPHPGALRVQPLVSALACRRPVSSLIGLLSSARPGGRRIRASRCRPPVRPARRGNAAIYVSVVDKDGSPCPTSSPTTSSSGRTAWRAKSCRSSRPPIRCRSPCWSTTARRRRAPFSSCATPSGRSSTRSPRRATRSRSSPSAIGRRSSSTRPRTRRRSEEGHRPAVRAAGLGHVPARGAHGDDAGLLEERNAAAGDRRRRDRGHRVQQPVATSW